MKPLTRFVHAADLHISGTVPRCRLDTDWSQTQRAMVAFLVATANKHQCPLVLCGDIFDKPRVATECVVFTIQELRKAAHGVYLLAGNHDLLQANVETLHQTSLGVLLEIFPHIPQIDGVQDAQPFGLDKSTGASVLFTHQLVFKDEKSRPPMAKGLTAAELLDQFPGAKWIFTGDHHDYWHYVSPDGRHVVNPGSTITHNTSKIGDKGYCALVDIEAESVQWIEIPDDPAMVSDGHLRKEEARESRIAAFLDMVKGATATVLDFKANLDARRQEKTVPESVNKAIGRIVVRATTEEK